MSLGPFDVLKDVVARLEKLNIDYFLVGSLASMYYSRPRFTNDIDLVLSILPSQIIEFEKQFPIEIYYCPPVEVIRDEVLRRGSFNLLHQASGVKVDIVLTQNSEFSKSEFSRRRKIEIVPGFQVFIATVEDVILKKLEFHRQGQSQKHILDIKDMLSSESIDQDYLRFWIEKLNLVNSWELANS